MIQLKVDPAKLPKAEELKALMFPGTLAVVVDDTSIRLVSRGSFPNNRGRAGHGSIGTALLLPAIQAALPGLGSRLRAGRRRQQVAAPAGAPAATPPAPPPAGRLPAPPGQQVPECQAAGGGLAEPIPVDLHLRAGGRPFKRPGGLRGLPDRRPHAWRARFPGKVSRGRVRKTRFRRRDFPGRLD